jgi:hypothetical protein
MKRARIFAVFVVCLSCAELAGCGGGGSSGGAPPPATPSISYGGTSFIVMAGSPLSLTPTNAGGAVSSWKAGALPAGLNFDTTTGVVSGTIAAALPPTSVTVTASNAGGSDNVTLIFGARSVLLQLGTLGAAAVAMTASNVLTEEGGYGNQHWILWNYPAGTIVAQGDTCTPQACTDQGVSPSTEIGLAGPIAVLASTPKAFQVLSATTGAVLSTVNFDANFWYQIASDGSYVCSGDSSALTAWSANGTAILSHKGGNYFPLGTARPAVVCNPTQMRVVMGPAGSNVIETVAVPSGASSVSAPFSGTFSSWFNDGGAFLSAAGNSVWVYSAAGTQLDAANLNVVAGLGGAGQWFWTFDGTTLNIYRVGSSAAPTVTYTANITAGNAQLQSSGETLLLLDSALHIIDLSGATPVKTDFVPPNAGIGSQFAAVSATQWVLAGSGILDGATLATTPRFFGYGNAKSIAGSATRVAVATAIGEVLIYDTSSWNVIATLPGLFTKVQISADGTVLATMGPGPYGTTQTLVQTFSLPAGTLIDSWTYNWDNNQPSALDFTLSSSGKLLGQVLSGTGAPTFLNPSRQVTLVSGGPVLWSDSGSTSQICLSSDDTLIAASLPVNGAPTTNVYLNDQFSGAVPGNVAGWLTGNYLLQNLATAAGPGPDAIYTTTAIKQNGPALPALLGPIQVLSSTLVFDASTGTIYSLSAGTKTWPAAGEQVSGGAGVGAGSVVYQSGNQLVVEPY